MTINQRGSQEGGGFGGEKMEKSKKQEGLSKQNLRTNERPSKTPNKPKSAEKRGSHEKLKKGGSPPIYE